MKVRGAFNDILRNGLRRIVDEEYAELGKPRRRRLRVRLEFKLQDMWVGAYWKPGHLWVCLLPTLPVHFYWE